MKETKTYCHPRQEIAEGEACREWNRTRWGNDYPTSNEVMETAKTIEVGGIEITAQPNEVVIGHSGIIIDNRG